MSRIHKWWVVGALALISGLGMGVLLVLIISSINAPPSVQGDSEASVSEVVLEPFDDPREIPLEVTFRQPSPLRAGVGGVITVMDCVPGRILKSGDSFISVSGRKLMSLHSATPMWRDITLGLAGPDVRAVKREMSRLGYKVSGSGPWAPVDAKSFQTLQRAVGAPASDGSVRLTSIVWLPAASVGVAECSAQLGDRISESDALAQPVGEVIAARVTPPVDAIEGERTLRLTRDEIPLEADGAVPSASLDALDLQLVNPAAGDASGPASQPIVTVALTTPLTVASLPASGVLAQKGSFCVIDSARSAPVLVTVVASSLGRTLVTFPGATPDAVIANPSAGASCG